MGHLLKGAVVVLLTFCVHGSLGCPAQKPQKAQKTQDELAMERINRILNEAKESNGSGTMHLGGYGIGPSSPSFPVVEWSPGTELIRPPEGGTLLIPCSNPNNTQVSRIAIPPAMAYNGRLLIINDVPKFLEPSTETFHCCNCTQEARPEEELRWVVGVSEYDVGTGAFTIKIANFSYAYTGLYECLHSNGSQRVVTKRYWVSPTHFRHDVFHLPMTNVTVRHGDPAEMVCPVRFNFLPGKLRHRFLWRRGDDLLWAKSILDLADAVTAPYDFNGFFQFASDEQCRCNSTMKLRSVTWKHAGWYECWFRINDRLDEWIMQKAYLHVI